MEREMRGRKRAPKGHRSESMSFNERADGYGAGPSESQNYRRPDSRDENGMPNPYGAVDQYSFRDVPVRKKFENDDHSRYAAADYRPGVSGKRNTGETWTNSAELQQQRNFMGKGPKGYKRSDDRIYEEVCMALMDSHEVDATDIGVKVEDGIVHLEGVVSDRQEKREAEMAIEDLPGVKDVRNSLRIRSQIGRISEGAESALRNDLGIQNSH